MKRYTKQNTPSGLALVWNPRHPTEPWLAPHPFQAKFLKGSSALKTPITVQIAKGSSNHFPYFVFPPVCLNPYDQQWKRNNNKYGIIRSCILPYNIGKVDSIPRKTCTISKLDQSLNGIMSHEADIAASANDRKIDICYFIHCDMIFFKIEIDTIFLLNRIKYM